MMKKKWKVALVATLIGLYAAYLWDDYQEPSDSGQMTWFTYLIVRNNADQGDGKAISQLIHHYEMDDAQVHAERIAELLMAGVMAGYGGVNQGRDRITMSFIENCANLGSKGPAQTAKLFAIVRERGGGLTAYGQDVEARWLKGEFPGCPPYRQ